MTCGDAFYHKEMKLYEREAALCLDSYNHSSQANTTNGANCTSFSVFFSEDQKIWFKDSRRATDKQILAYES